MNALEYHEVTKHFFNRFARSAGYLDWASQPNPFRRFEGASELALSREAVAPEVPYESLFDGSSRALPMQHETVSELLRCAMGLSAWKQHQTSRWALRVNPSSGNLHPTETYIVWSDRVYHYAPREHALEERCVLGHSPESGFLSSTHQHLLVGLTSIFWREAWKYGERAFRYCQHDLGHALGALRLSAARLGWKMRLMTDWSDADIATLLGVDRDEDFGDAEREAPECLALVSVPENAGSPSAGFRDAALERDDRSIWLEAAREGAWTGRANRLSPSRVEWPIIDAVAEATRYPGTANSSRPASHAVGRNSAPGGPSARTIFLQRRSALAFDGRTTLPREAFLGMLSRVRHEQPPWDVAPWPPHVHLALFVHRVEGLAPGIYAFLRDTSAAAEWRDAMRSQFLWEPLRDPVGRVRDGELYFLLPFDMTWPAARVSCDQDIAADGFFSLAMVGRVGSSIRRHGEWFYRRLFWEAGLIGQVLYLEAEAVGFSATGIGCFYDDAVHELLGLALESRSSTRDEEDQFDARQSEWQSLYHFTVGRPVVDARLTSEPGYAWER